jgi:serine/threonine-protein kinase HipA
VLISHRYDRIRDSTGRWRRLHQEDICQALSIPPSKKYQSDGGPGLREIGDLLLASGSGKERRENLRRMFDYVVFNVAIAATDAHAKNFSVLLSARAVRLAPLYDVASILPYDQEPGLRSAMKIGSTWEMAAVSDKDWAVVGQRLGLGSDESISRAQAVRRRIPDAFRSAANERQIPDELTERANWIADLVAAHVQGRRNQWGQIDVPRPSS